MTELEAALRSMVVFVHDLKEHWPNAKCDAYTEECVGGIFATLPLAEKVIAALDEEFLQSRAE